MRSRRATGPRATGKGAARRHSALIWCASKRSGGHASQELVTSLTGLLWIEGGYSFLGALLVGVIVGAVPRRVFVKDTE